MYAVDHLPFLKERFTAWFHLSIYGFCSGRLIGIILLPSACSSFDPSYHWISTGCYFLTLWRNQFLCSFSCILFTGSIPKLLECKYFRKYYTLTSYFWEIESLSIFKKDWFICFCFWLCWVSVATFSSCGEWGLLFIPAWGLLIAVASLVAECGLVVSAHKLSICSLQALECWLSSCGALAWLAHGMWDLPGPGVEPVPPALAGGFLSTRPSGKPRFFVFK